MTGNWECPDFFPVLREGKNGVDTSTVGKNVRHILKVSLDQTRYEYYTIGTYNPKTDKYIPDNTSVDGWDGLRLDYGNFYGSKTFYDPSKNRRILWGWVNESDSRMNDTAKGWSGIQVKIYESVFCLHKIVYDVQELGILCSCIASYCLIVITMKHFRLILVCIPVFPRRFRGLCGLIAMENISCIGLSRK